MEFGELHAQCPDAKKIACKDCIYRDRTEIDIGSGPVRIGVVKIWCDKYSRKPKEILWQNAKCPYYEKDDGI